MAYTRYHSAKILNTQVCNSIVAMVTDLLRHLTYNSREAWHTLMAYRVCHAPLKLEVKCYLIFHTREKCVFVMIPVSREFSNNVILC